MTKLVFSMYVLENPSKDYYYLHLIYTDGSKSDIGVTKGFYETFTKLYTGF